MIALVVSKSSPNLSDSNIRQQILISVINDRQDPKVVKRYSGNNNHFCKVKDNQAAAISAAQYYFILK